MGKRLLVVDSDRRFIQDHKSPLESAFEADFLFATEGALIHLENGQFGAILLCVETSENKGYALCSAIRRTPALADLKIALISAKASEEEYARHRATKGKADLYLHKPITPTALVPALAALLPMREDDPDNPLGDLAGADLGDEWLESLKTELDMEPAPRAVLPPPVLDPPAMPTLSLDPPVLPALTLDPPVLEAPAPDRSARNEGEVELLEWRVKDLELKLAAQFQELERKTREIEELIQRNAAVTRNLDDVQQRQTEEELLRGRVQELEGEADRLQQEIQAAREREGGLGSQVEDLQVLLAEKTRQNADLMESHQLLQAQLEEAWEQGDRLRGLEGALAGAQEAARSLEVRASLAEKDRTELQNEREALQAERTGLQERLRDQETSLGRLKDLEEELASAKDQVSFQELTLRNLAEERNTLKAERERQEEAFTEQAGEILVLQERITLLDGSIRDLGEERSHLAETRDQLEMDLAGAERRLEAEATAHEQQQRELLAGIDEREAHLGRLNTTLEAQRERIARMDQEKAELQEEVQRRNDRLGAITGVLTDLEGKARQALDLAKAVSN